MEAPPHAGVRLEAVLVALLRHTAPGGSPHPLCGEEAVICALKA